MFFQQILKKAHSLAITSISVLLLAVNMAGAVQYDISIARDEWYGATLQGMAARKLYYCGIINGTVTSPERITEDIFALDQSLTIRDAQTILSRCSEKDLDLLPIREGPDSNKAITETEFLALIGEEKHDDSLICPQGGFTRGHAFEILAEKVDAHNYNAGRKPFSSPHRMQVQAQTVDDALVLIERGFEYGSEQIELSGPKEVLKEVQQMYEDNEKARREENYDKQLLNDIYVQYIGSMPSSYMQADFLSVSISTISDYVYLHLDDQGWISCQKDQTYSKAYNDFIKKRILPLKEKYTSVTNLVRAVNDVICSRASYAYHHNLDDWTIHSLEGFFDNGKIVCDGYAAVFRACMYELDIPCVIVMNNDWTHAWNKVYIGDRWLHVDVCWSDTGYGNRSILLTDKQIIALGGHDNPSYCGRAYNSNTLSEIS